MIVEDVTRQMQGKASIKPLAAYMLRLGPSLARDPVDWGLGKSRETEEVAWAKAVNCASQNLGYAIKDMDLTQQLNHRATTNKNYHYVVSFPEGEKPSREILENIEEVLSTAIGYKDHQRLIAVHKDTAHLHMHVAINRVHPETFKCLSQPWDHLTLQRTSAELEKVHNLQQTNHTPFSRTTSRKPFQPAWQAKPAQEIDPDLYAQYKAERKKALDQRNTALAALRQQHLAYAQKLTLWHKQRLSNAKAAKLNKGDRLATQAYLKSSFDKDHAERKLREKQERDALKQRYPLLPSFDAFRKLQSGHANDQARDHAYDRDR